MFVYSHTHVLARTHTRDRCTYACASAQICTHAHTRAPVGIFNTLLLFIYYVSIIFQPGTELEYFRSNHKKAFVNDDGGVKAEDGTEHSSLAR